MSIPKRHQSTPGTYFLTSRTWQSRPIFKSSAPCEVFIESLLHYREDGAYALHEFVLMPDHFHVLLTPGDEVTLERAVQFIKGGSAKRIRDRLLFRFPIWQRGFSDHRIRDAADYESHAQYVAANPLKKNLAAEVAEYPWCSLSGKFHMDEIPQGLKPLSMGVANRHG
jgi:putative transposase